MRESILIADDVQMNRDILGQLFTFSYDIVEACDGQQAIEILKVKRHDVSIVLLDIVMPRANGIEVLHYMHSAHLIDHIPVILITGTKDDSFEKEAYDLGVSDIIMKPFDSYIVTRRVENVLNLYRHKNNLELMVDLQTRQLKEQAKRLKETNDFVIDTLSTVVESRDFESGAHILRIRKFTRLLLESVKFKNPEYMLTDDSIEKIVSASALHDIGKIATPDGILLKPGKLTSAEFEIMKKHTIEGCKILSRLNHISDKEFYTYCQDICRSHHERWDGKGYPDGLKRDEIPIWTSVVSIADVYDALVTDRVYKKAYTHEQAVSMILNGDCGCFSPELIQRFVEVEAQFKLYANLS